MQKKEYDIYEKNLLLTRLKEEFILQKRPVQFGRKYLMRKKTGEAENAEGSVTCYTMEKYYMVTVMEFKGKYELCLSKTKKEADMVRMTYCMEGECSFKIRVRGEDEKMLVFKEGDLLVYRSGNKMEKIEFSSDRIRFMTIEYSFYELVMKFMNGLDSGMVKKWLEEMDSLMDPGEFFYCERNAEINSLINVIKEISSAKSADEHLRINAKVFQLLTQVMDIKKNIYFSHGKMSSSEIVDRTKKILEMRHFTENFSIKDICRILGINRYRLNKAFKEREGKGIREYIGGRRMEYSKYLFETTDDNIVEVSIKCGYENPSKFSKSFKKYFGILPNRYRKNLERRKRGEYEEKQCSEGKKE